MSPVLRPAAQLRDYCPIFFPGKHDNLDSLLKLVIDILHDFLVSPLQRNGISGHIEQAILGFASRLVKVEVTCGCHFPFMQISVSELTPLECQLFNPPPIILNNEGHALCEQPAPMIWREGGFDSLLETCNAYIERMASCLQDFTPATTETLYSIRFELIRAICRYHDTTSLPSNVRTMLSHEHAIFGY